MKNGLFTLDWGSVADAVVTAVIFAVLSALVQLVATNGFDIFTANWVAIGHTMANVAFITGIVSLGQDLLSTNTGSVLALTPAAPTQ